MPFNVDRWRSDEEVALLGCVGRTVWFESLIVMWKRDRNGELSGTYAEIAKLCRVSPAEAQAGVKEIKARNVGDVTESNGVVTLICRGMKREHENRVSVRGRVTNHRKRKRGHGDETPDVTREVTQMKQPDRGTDPPPASPSPTPSPPIPPTSQFPSEIEGAASAAVSGKRRRDSVPMPEIPSDLDTPEFRKAWEAFVKWRGSGQHRITPNAAIILLGKCREWGVKAAIESIETSIAGAWRALYPPRNLNRGSNVRTKPTAAERGEYEQQHRELPTIGAADREPDRFGSGADPR